MANCKRTRKQLSMSKIWTYSAQYSSSKKHRLLYHLGNSVRIMDIPMSWPVVKNGRKYHTIRRTTCPLLSQVFRADHPVQVRHRRVLRLHHRTQRERNLRRDQLKDQNRTGDGLEETRSGLLSWKSRTILHGETWSMICWNGYRNSLKMWWNGKLQSQKQRALGSQEASCVHTLPEGSKLRSMQKDLNCEGPLQKNALVIQSHPLKSLVIWLWLTTKFFAKKVKSRDNHRYAVMGEVQRPFTGIWRKLLKMFYRIIVRQHSIEPRQTAS